MFYAQSTITVISGRPLPQTGISFFIYYFLGCLLKVYTSLKQFSSLYFSCSEIGLVVWSGICHAGFVFWHCRRRNGFVCALLHGQPDNSTLEVMITALSLSFSASRSVLSFDKTQAIIVTCEKRDSGIWDLIRLGPHTYTHTRCAGPQTRGPREQWRCWRSFRHLLNTRLSAILLRFSPLWSGNFLVAETIGSSGTNGSNVCHHWQDSEPIERLVRIYR